MLEYTKCRPGAENRFYMKRISAERKEAVIKKMLPPLSMSVHELMEIEGISRSTLYDWKTSLFSDGEEMPNLERDAPNYLSAEAKFECGD